MMVMEHSGVGGVVVDDEQVKILPPEIWGMILENLKGDPGSLLNCSRTCQTLKGLLEKDKVDWLFPLVVPLLEKYLSGNELLACRRVSKKWKHGVDQFRQSAVQQWTPHFSDDDMMINRVSGRLEEEEGGGGGIGSYQGRNVFNRIEQLEGFHQQMADHPGNPFPSKSLIYQSGSHRWWNEDEFDIDIVRRDAWETNGALVTLLTTSGLHVTDFTYISGNLTFGTPLHVAIADALQTLPNLRSLSVHHLVPKVVFPGHALEPTLPELHHLRCLTLRAECYRLINCQELAKAFNPLLVAYGRQLEQLELDSELFLETDYLNPKLPLSQQAGTTTTRCCVDLPKDSELLVSLRRLKIRNIQRRNLSFTSLVESKLVNLQLPNLQQVSLHFFNLRSWLRGEKVELRRLFGLLDCWSSTLIEVHLLVELPQLEIYSRFYSPEDSAESQAALEKQVPFLKVLGVCFSLLNSDMLLWVVNKFPKLERLELHGFKDNAVRGVSLSDLVSEGESDDDEEEEPDRPPRPPPPASSSLPKVRRAHQDILDALWELVPTLTEIIVWDCVMSAAAPKRVFHWHRAEQKKSCEGSDQWWLQDSSAHFRGQEVI